ncbi:MAG TPA: PepSY domain-containing protein [Methyloceanibacter sp.]|nr:PepSY domain-containing protein [Methyloceanibacter sp.]
MRRFLWIVILSLSAATLPAAAEADRLTLEDVRAMAFDKGIATIKEIELDDGIWEVEGRDDRGHKFKMKVDARSGEIVKMRRND